MDDNLLIVKAKDFQIKHELLLKRIYYHQFIEGSAARYGDIRIIAKELRPEAEIAEIGEIEIRQHYDYLVGEGLIEHGRPPGPPPPIDSPWYVIWRGVTGYSFPDTRLAHKGIKKAKRLILTDSDSEEQLSKAHLVEETLEIDPETEQLLRNKGKMREHHVDYSVNTAIEIYKKMPIAWKNCGADRKWGPGVIAEEMTIESPAVGRYLKAFRGVGLEKLNGIPLPPKYHSAK